MLAEFSKSADESGMDPEPGPRKCFVHFLGEEILHIIYDYCNFKTDEEKAATKEREEVKEKKRQSREDQRVVIWKAKYALIMVHVGLTNDERILRLRKATSKLPYRIAPRVYVAGESRRDKNVPLHDVLTCVVCVSVCG